jgi:hypothetical protein
MPTPIRLHLSGNHGSSPPGENPEPPAPTA